MRANEFELWHTIYFDRLHPDDEVWSEHFWRAFEAAMVRAEQLPEESQDSSVDWEVVGWTVFGCVAAIMIGLAIIFGK